MVSGVQGGKQKVSSTVTVPVIAAFALNVSRSSVYISKYPFIASLLSKTCFALWSILILCRLP